MASVEEVERAPTSDELRGMSNEEIARRYDALIHLHRREGRHDTVGPSFYRDELRLRMLELQAQEMVRLAERVVIASGVIVLVLVVVLLVTA